MSESKTEKPTKQKLKKAKEKGQVAKSAFLAGSLVFTGGALLIWALSCLFAAGFQTSMRNAFSLLKEPSIDGIFQTILTPLILPVLIFLLGILIIAIAAHLFQTGWLWATDRIRPAWRKKKGERRIVLPLLQFAVIAGIGYMAIHTKLDPNLFFLPPSQQSAAIFKKIIFLLIVMGALLLVLGLCDFLYQKWRYYKQMHMTPEEKREETKESEGDPDIKERMRDRRD